VLGFQHERRRVSTASFVRQRADLPDIGKNGKKRTKTSTKPSKAKGKAEPRRRRSSTAGDLFSQVVTATGIPSESIEKELRSLLERRGVNAERLTLAQLRAAVAQYLREVMAELLERTHRPTRTDP